MHYTVTRLFLIILLSVFSNQSIKAAYPKALTAAATSALCSDDGRDDAALSSLEQSVSSTPKTNAQIAAEIKDSAQRTTEALWSLIESALAPNEIKAGLKPNHLETLTTTLEQEAQAVQRLFAVAAHDKNIQMMIEAQRKQESLYQGLQEVDKKLQAKIQHSIQQLLGATRTLKGVIGGHITSLGKQKGDNKAAIGTAQQQKIQKDIGAVRLATVSLVPKAKPTIPPIPVPVVVNAQTLNKEIMGLAASIGVLEQQPTLTVEQQKELESLKEQLATAKQKAEERKKDIDSCFSKLPALQLLLPAITKESNLLAELDERAERAVDPENMRKDIIELADALKEYMTKLSKQLSKTQPKKQKQAFKKSELIKALLSAIAYARENDPAVIKFVINTLHGKNIKVDTYHQALCGAVISFVKENMAKISPTTDCEKLISAVLLEECATLEAKFGMYE